MINPLVVDPWIWKNPGPFRVGDRVRFTFGSHQVDATVIEDRGILGKGGKRIYRLMFLPDDVSGEMFVERVVDDLTLVARAPDPSPKKSRKKKGRQE